MYELLNLGSLSKVVVFALKALKVYNSSREAEKGEIVVYQIYACVLF